jgi:putative hydrolase of the HAD superfamily
MNRIEAIISDFGGVLTVPLIDSFLAFERSHGVSPEAFGNALTAIAERDGANPIYALEAGLLTADAFLRDLGVQLSGALDREVDVMDFGEFYFRELHPSQVMLDFMRELQQRGYRMALCTNNVREWEPYWRPKIPVDEIFSVVVDSGFVGVRKPDHEIYALTLERLGVSAETALLVDDIELNCASARELGMRAVHFRDADQAIAEIEELLG